MNSNIEFQPVGYIKSFFDFGPKERAFLIESEEELQNLWQSLNEPNVNTPKIDFRHDKLLVVKDNLRSIGCFLFVQKVQFVAEKMLQITCGEVSDGGEVAQSPGFAYQFLAVDRALSFVWTDIEPLSFTTIVDRKLTEYRTQLDACDYSILSRKDLQILYNKRYQLLLNRYLGPKLGVFLPPSQK